MTLDLFKKHLHQLSLANRRGRRRSVKVRRTGLQGETVEQRMLLSGVTGSPADGILNGSFESFTGRNGWTITKDVEGWRGVDAESVSTDTPVDPDSLPDSQGIEVWRNMGKKSYAGINQIELDGHGNVVDAVYQKFSTDTATNLMFTAYARQGNSSDIEVYIDGQYVETVRPPKPGRVYAHQAYFYPIEAGEHSIMFKEVNGQNDGHGAVIDNVRLVSDQMKMMLDSGGRHTHNFHEHVSDMFGTELMAPGQTEYDAKGFEKVSDTLYRGNSPITGLRPVIEEAIDREIKRNPRLEGQVLESKIANRLTNLNDFSQLQTETQDKLIEMTGIDFRAMTKQQREHTINHLLHSPIPFGNIEEVLAPDARIDLGFTHTLDKSYTRVGHLGDGVWKVWMISNNNNGSHTGHNLGEFKVRLGEDITPNQARAEANKMIINQNNNNRLTLDEAAKDILYGTTPRLDPVDRDAPVNDGIVNGSFESFTGRNGWTITKDVEGWFGVRAQTVNKEIGVDPDSLPDSQGIEVWRNSGKKSYAGINQIELDGHGNVVDAVYQKFSTDTATNLMFTAYARQGNSSDIEVYIDGQYVETVRPPKPGRVYAHQAYFYPIEAGEHSIMFKEVNGQNDGHGAVIDNVRLVSDQMKMMLDSGGRHTHNFHEHVSDMFGTELMAPGQTEYDAKGFEKVSDTLYRGNSPITGLRPVIEEAIDREIKRNPRLEGQALESKIANRLTNLNDFSQLQTETQDRLIEMTGIDFRAMTKQQREHTINHLLHSPIPFGNIEEVLAPDARIDLGFTHTLDKSYTRVGHLGDGVWKVWMISNNNNGSHTGHNLGEFKVRLGEDITPNQARAEANKMIINQNNNNRLTLDEAAKDILYGTTPRLDPVDRDAPVNDGIVNGSFESFTGRNGWTITKDVEGWFGVRAQTVNREIGVDPDSLPDSQGIEVWRNRGKKSYAGINQIELDGHGNVVDAVYQKFSTDTATNLMFTAYARQGNSSDIEVYIDGQYVETVRPPKPGRVYAHQAYFYPIEAGEHSIMFKEVNGQNDGHGAVIDNVRLVSDQMKMMLDSGGRHTHNFHEHVSDMFGTELMAPGQTEYDAKGFEKVSDTLYRGNSPITGLRPVIEEAIDREIKRNPRLEGQVLESKIANRLTNLNDFSQLQTETQDKLIEMTGIDFRAMTKQQREHTINHLLHSPIPFGNIEEVLAPDARIDLGFTHTLDKSYTRVGHLGDGVWKVWMISNNNNGSHTGHNLGEFKVRLGEDITPNQARAEANKMIINQNNNNRLTLDEAAKDILYGTTPRLDPVDRDAPVNDGIVNGSFESFTGRNGWTITKDVEGWFGVRAQTVNKEIGVDPDSLPDSQGIEVWRNSGKKSYAGINQIELDGHGNVVDAVYQKFSTDTATNLMFTAYARQGNSSDIEVYIDGQYVETVRPPKPGRVYAHQAYFYPIEAGEHSIMFKEVNGQNDGHGAVIDNVRLVSDQMKMMLDSGGRHTHNFHEHVSDMFGTELMAPGQTEYDAKGFEKVSDTLYRGNSPITGLRPVIEEAIDREIKRNPRLEGQALESKIANRLTNLNDFSQLQTETQDRLIEMTGIDFRAMTKQQREHTINHLLHSPIPFGNIEEVLAPDARIDLGFTHTLDKSYTRVGHLGDGVWKVWMISNNNNGSHTGHNLGEFKVRLGEDITPNQARAEANKMIINQNNNNRLTLDEAAKDILYGTTPRLDPVDRDAPVNDGIVNGSFESFTGRNGWTITKDVEGWFGVRAQTVNREIGVDPDSLPDSQGIEVWRNRGKKSYAGINQIELDGHGNVVDAVYQKFSTDTATNLMFTAYARQGNSSDIEVYIDGQYVETVRPPKPGRVYAHQAYFYPIEAGEHSIMFKEVNGQNDGRGAVIDNVRLVSDQMKMMLDSGGRHTHNFHEHVSDMFGTELMAPGQTEYDAKGFEKVSDTLYRGNSPITGLRPVIEEAIDREIKRNPRLEGQALESKIANRLTNLNDFSQLQTETQDRLIEMTGIDFRAMTKQQREHTINHLLHSPIPFGNIEEVLAPDARIDLGFTHTLDKSYTRVGHLGDGVWKVWIISNNNNGSHTGHNLGEFKVRLGEDITPNQARAEANKMIINQNNNNRLTLDEAAKDILYGTTPRLGDTGNTASRNSLFDEDDKVGLF